ncbi:host specificity protein J [Zophobihabitans entericus]|uniref:Host specificity protein J n=1 Tax=Zophobihabitans entericus TaxID=1635327 RepID=A0A6G9IB16_9GAMM|nr:phage tail protein [Zophobihabitans entericus]QIQ21027.1 host specificity protein J [Zophobihabitans entericus]
MGKGGGKTKVPYEQPDNLKSRQQLSIIDLLCEGQIEGPVDGLKGVYLNKTPIQAADNSYNFKGIEAEWLSGTQEQDPLEGFPATENEIPVSLEVKKASPIVRSITDSNIDRLRVTVGVSGLYQQKDNGDMVGTTARLLVQVGSGSSWRTIETVNFSGKVRSQYLKSVTIENLPEVPFNLRVVRETEDSTSARLENKTLWSSYTEIYDVKLTYPNTAIVGLRFDSEQFSGVPRRQYLVKGMVVKVPDNYDPNTRSYQGLWMGNFKLAWTDNPAWIFYDLVTNTRYGLGERLGQFSCDKFTLYTIAQYCDQLVDDGFGNQEPRFTCNCYITNQRQAYDVINDLCSVFRSLPVWDGIQLSAVMDRPADTTYIYTNANVVEGKFNYSSSPQKSRHTAAHVRYVDPDNGWETATEYVADDDLIRRFGLNVSKIDAFGCTSRGQAHRIGKWLIQTEKLEKQTVSFAIGREGLRHLPGDIIGIADNDYAGAKIGGRIKSIEGNTVVLDKEIELEEPSKAWISYIDNQGVLQKVAVLSQPKTDTLVLTDEISVSEWSVWMLSTSAIKPRLFKALTITENDDGTYTISALQHIPEKETIVDKGANFESDNHTLYGLNIPPVENLQVEATPESDLWQAKVIWNTPRSLNQLKFEIKVLSDAKVKFREVIAGTEYLLTDLQQGLYNVIVRGIGKDGQLGDETTASFSILPPSKPDTLLLTPSNFSVAIRPVSGGLTSLGTQYEFYKGLSRQEVEEKKNYLGRSIVMIDQDCQPLTEYWYGVNAINLVGRSEMVIMNTETLAATNGSGGFFRIQTDDGIFPDNDKATALFFSEFGFYPARDTTLTIYSLDENGQILVSNSCLYDGSQWIIPKMFLDGNLVATGTIKGDRLIAGTEINAPQINGGVIQAGTVVSSGTPPLFQLLPDGTLVAKKAEISGIINAESGVLNDVTVNGTIYAQDGYFNGTVYANKIQGDVVTPILLEAGKTVILEPVDYKRVIVSHPIVVKAYHRYSLVGDNREQHYYGAATVTVNINNSSFVTSTTSVQYSKTCNVDSKIIRYNLDVNTSAKITCAKSTAHSGFAPDFVFLLVMRDNS